MPALPTLFEMLSALIAIPSISSMKSELDQSNKQLIMRLADWSETIGLRCQVQTIPNHPTKFNLIAQLGEGEQGLILAGHSDTVPYDITRWTTDPFHLTQANQRFYGLGTSDMKSFFALALAAIAQFNAKQLRQPVILVATADEESSMSGAKYLAESTELSARYALIGEPTNLQPIRMHKGIFMEAIHLTGLSGHSSDPKLGRNALEGMSQVMGEVLNWRNELQLRYQHCAFHVPVPTVNLGHIFGGDSPNRICGDCELHIDVRLLPGMILKEIREELHHRVQQRIMNSGLDVQFISLFDGIAPMETPATSAIVQETERLTGHLAQAVAFGTEAPFLQQLGIETVILGAGDIAQAHQPNEFIAIERLNPMIHILTQLIHKFCM
jgi:acetylornithine deacetylase (ArgE)